MSFCLQYEQQKRKEDTLIMVSEVKEGMGSDAWQVCITISDFRSQRAALLALPLCTDFRGIRIRGD